MENNLSKDLIKSYNDAYVLLGNFISNSENIAKTSAVSEIIAECFKNKKKVLICGNGGSACDSLHFAEEFTCKYRDNRPALPVIPLLESSFLTAAGNDYSFNKIFERGVEAYGQKNDILVAISTSGNSENIILAVERAKKIGVKTVALLGRDGGKLSGMCDYEFIVPGKTSDRIQEIHMIILHIIIEGVERILFPGNYEE